MFALGVRNLDGGVGAVVRSLENASLLQVSFSTGPLAVDRKVIANYASDQNRRDYPEEAERNQKRPLVTYLISIRLEFMLLTFSFRPKSFSIR